MSRRRTEACGRRICRECGRWRYQWDFPFHNGYIAWRCLPCKRAYEREWREANLEERREEQRIWREGFRRRRGIPARNLTRPVPQHPDEATVVPVEPFAQWVKHQLERRPVRELAMWLNVGERAIWRWLNESNTIHIDSVDRALVNAGQQHLLNELYPVLTGGTQ